ncbi:gnk2-like domain-containing protein [Artemisia annua]|uniref:Gnk2-like domain-containing protein n=1 Tax=Artemisia annua TaxID=35608 RepID=A0A2U1MBA6_ARTAN|nr:gnk2-like domain-containing protein [Artemisia annua]
MLQQAISFSFPLFSFILSIVSISALNSNIYIQCSQSCFVSTTPYESNVISLFTSLVDSATVCNFNKFAICPPGYSQNNIVYGLFQCRGDLSFSDCKECVMSSITQLKATCPVSTGGAIQLDGCFVKYDNFSFFGDENRGEVLKRCGPPVAYNSDVLSRIDNALAYLIAGNGKYFRAIDYGGHTRCGTVQASGKLRSECAPSTWGDMYLGKCFIRYADQAVNGANSDGNTYTGSSNSNRRRGKGRKGNSRKIAYIVGGSIAAGLTITLYMTINCNKQRITNNNINVVKEDLKGKAKEIEANKKAIEVNKKGVEGNKKSIEATNKTVAETKYGVEIARHLAYEAEWKAHEAMRYARSNCHHGCVGHCHHLLAIF